jgi:hypothetical protein
MVFVGFVHLCLPKASVFSTVPIRSAMHDPPSSEVSSIGGGRGSPRLPLVEREMLQHSSANNGEQENK